MWVLFFKRTCIVRLSILQIMFCPKSSILKEVFYISSYVIKYFKCNFLESKLGELLTMFKNALKIHLNMVPKLNNSQTCRYSYILLYSR